MKREAQDLLHELQRETDRLKDSLDVLDKNPDQQVRIRIRSLKSMSHETF